MRTLMESFPLREVVAARLAGAAGQGWQLREEVQWCYVTPRNHPARVQGWKLHVSATWVSAPVVLYQAAGVLVEQGCAFKFAATLGRVMELTSKGTDRAQAGKFLTAYPRDDDHLRMLAPLLDQATAGLPGPAVLSDRPVREGSLVHYRYGSFSGVPTVTNDGLLEVRLEAPDGTLVEDVRQPWFCPPAWAELPVGGPPGRGSAQPVDPKPVLLGGRFKVVRAIRHSARGGVFRATDVETGQAVVVKQARAHISGLTFVGDAREGLRHESAMLAKLGGVAPREVALFEHGSYLFLVVEQLEGESLAGWVQRWWQDSAGPAALGGHAEPAGRTADTEGPPVAEAVAMAARLAEVVDGVHERGVVFRDLSPNNVMVLEDGSVRLVDAELVAQPGQWVTNAHTPGYVAPELLSGVGFGPAPGPSADHFSLGALLCYLTTGMPPVFIADSPGEGAAAGGEAADGAAGGRGPNERIGLVLRYASPRNPAATRLAPAILGLTADDPERRWTTGRLRAFLADPPPEPAAFPDGEPRAGLEPDRQRRLAEDGLGHLVASLAYAEERLVPSSEYGARSDPCNVQHGTGGVLAVLVRASELSGEERLREAVAKVARWTDRRRMSGAKLLPGLYFGRAGTAWALYEAGRHLDDAGLVERALELALALPVRWPNPDITHGTAGLGMASLHLWRETKEPVLLERVNTAADRVAERVAYTVDRAVHWPVPQDFDSNLAGATHLGFAHGVAGVAAFLLAVAAVTGRTDCLRLAEQAGAGLADAAVPAGDGVYWPNDISGPGTSDLRYHWCSGASGVGTFLVRLWQATGTDRYRQLAQQAAVTVRRGRWVSGLAACHGLAGNGEFLLDLAQAFGGPYRGWAEEHAAGLYVRHGLRDGRLVVGDESGPGARLNLDFNTGAAGVVGFALRLCHGGPRWWMVDTAARGPGDRAATER